MLYLSEFVSESKFREGMILCLQMMKSSPYFDSQLQYHKDTLYQLFQHKLFPKLSGLVNVLTEPLLVNHYPTMLTDSNWLLEKHQYYKLAVTIEDDYSSYEGEVVCGVFETNFGHTVVLMNQLNDTDLNVEFYHFDQQRLLRKFHSFVVKIHVDGKLFFRSGMNHMVSTDELSWCHHSNLNKIDPPYNVTGSSIILTEILSMVENHDSNNS